MTRTGCTFFILSVGFALWVGAVDMNPQQILTFSCGSTFPPDVDVEQLRQRFGVANVSTDSIHIGEGQYLKGTLLFPDDSTRRVEIVWEDSVAQRSPSLVRIGGRRSAWRTPTGLTLGMTLRAVEQANGRPFRILGFGFDGSGFVTSWSDGSLADRPDSPCRTHARLGPDETSRQTHPESYRQLIGDREFSSSHPAMQALSPLVNEIQLRYH